MLLGPEKCPAANAYTPKAKRETLLLDKDITTNLKRDLLA